MSVRSLIGGLIRSYIVIVESKGGRNYWLFNLLADVRYGPDWLKPLDSPRGVPDDASYAYRQLVEDWDGDGHSHSYFTLT